MSQHMYAICVYVCVYIYIIHTNTEVVTKVVQTFFSSGTSWNFHLLSRIEHLLPATRAGEILYFQYWHTGVGFHGLWV